MRLTKAVKHQIIENWVSKKWKKKLEDSRTKLRGSVVSAAEKQFSNEIAIYEENKGISKYLNCHSYVRVYYLDGKVKDCDFVNSIGKNVDIKTYVSTSKYQNNDVDLSDKIIVKAIDKHNEVITNFDSEKQSIESILSSSTTINKLTEVLPDISKYIPEMSSCTSLVDVATIKKATDAL